MNKPHEPQGSPITIRNVDVANSAVAIGSGARARNEVEVTPHAECQEALSALRERLQALHEAGELPADRLGAAIEQADGLGRELDGPSPRPGAILARLGALTAALDGVAHLGDVLTRVMKVVGAVFGG